MRPENILLPLIFAVMTCLPSVATAGGTPLTLLQEASFYGNVDLVEELLARGADVNETHYGWTPLHLARQNDHTGVVWLLLAAGAVDNPFPRPRPFATNGCALSNPGR